MAVKFVKVTVSDFVCPIPLCPLTAPAPVFNFKDTLPKEFVLSHEVKKVRPRRHKRKCCSDW